MLVNLILTVFVFFCRTSATTTDGDSIDIPVARTHLGLVVGQLENTFKNTTYATFLGIPFAKPPVGDLRFRPPQPAVPWDGALKADTLKGTCPQISWQKYWGAEDCLYLNIFTPIGGSGSKPVMVFIFGGAYRWGSPDEDPELLMDEDVVVVLVSYRVSVLGYLSLDTAEVPGNVALKDQSLALRFVKRNIKNFSGDPDNITLFGVSTGATSVHHLLMSKMSRDLFHKAIMMSGTAMTPWSSYLEPGDSAERLAKQLGMEHLNRNSSDFLESLNNVPIEDLCWAADRVSSESTSDKYTPFVPYKENTFDGVESFFDKRPDEQLRDGDFKHMPVMIGHTSKEFIFVLFDALFHLNDDLGKSVDKNISLIPRPWRSGMSRDDLDTMAKRIKNFYLNSQQLDVNNEDMYLKAIDMLGDAFFTMSIIRGASIMAEHSTEPVYYYRFSYRGNVNHPIVKTGGFQGATHGDDKRYVLRRKTEVRPNERSSDGIVRKRMLKLFTNFARTGNPTPDNLDHLITTQWPAMKPGAPYYMEINQDMTVNIDPEKERRQFWEDLEKKWISGDL